MLYDAILIDADDTLFDFRGAEKNAIGAIIQQLGIMDEAAPQVYHRLNKACWEAFERGEVTQAELRVRRFRDFLTAEFGLSEKCVPVGMSCGGLHAVKLAAAHPEMVSALYLDAPVINLLSCPFGLGGGSDLEPSTQQEALDALRQAISRLDGADERNVGELMLRAAAFARARGVDPELALSAATDRLIDRFAADEGR